jgi:hypothetical protein
MVPGEVQRDLRRSPNLDGPDRKRQEYISVNTLANIADGLGVTLSTLFAGVERGAPNAEAGKAASAKTPAHNEPVIRAGQHTVQVLVKELRAERAALERTVATLREVALDRRPKPETRSKPRQSR